MATTTTTLADYISKKGMQQIIIRVEHSGRHRPIPVGWSINAAFFKKGRAISKHPDAMLINSAIASKEAEINKYLADCQIHGKPIVLDLIGTPQTSHSFTGYLRHRGEQYKTAGKIIISRKVRRFVTELTESHGREVFFEDINADFLRTLEQYMITNKNANNTRHKKFKILGTYFGNAMEEGKTKGPNLFKKYKISTTPVKKGKLTEEEIKTIEGLDLKPGAVADARNMFLFSFYSKGQRFETCLMLRRKQISEGRIFFQTNKGHDHISIKIHSRLQAILDLYPAKNYIFPFVQKEPANKEQYLKTVDTFNVIVNRNLEVVRAAAGIKKHITFHIARHTFADQLMRKSKSLGIVKEALQHSAERITRMYINSLGDEILDPEMEKLYGE